MSAVPTEPGIVLTPLRHQAAATSTQLPPAAPKPTSLTEQTEASSILWSSATTDVGIWECEPGRFTADRSASTEICQVLTGTAQVTGEDGTTAELGPGSLLVLPRGWRGTWTIHETLRKTYVILQ